MCRIQFSVAQRGAHDWIQALGLLVVELQGTGIPQDDRILRVNTEARQASLHTMLQLIHNTLGYTILQVSVLLQYYIAIIFVLCFNPNDFSFPNLRRFGQKPRDSPKLTVSAKALLVLSSSPRTTSSG